VIDFFMPAATRLMASPQPERVLAAALASMSGFRWVAGSGGFGWSRGLAWVWLQLDCVLAAALASMSGFRWVAGSVLFSAGSALFSADDFYRAACCSIGTRLRSAAASVYCQCLQFACSRCWLMAHVSRLLLLLCLPQVCCSGAQPADWRGGHGDHQDDGQRGQAGRLQQRGTLPGAGARHIKWHIDGDFVVRPAVAVCGWPQLSMPSRRV
jgi:hypothetical protein